MMCALRLGIRSGDVRAKNLDLALGMHLEKHEGPDVVPQVLDYLAGEEGFEPTISAFRAQRLRPAWPLPNREGNEPGEAQPRTRHFTAFCAEWHASSG